MHRKTRVRRMQGVDWYQPETHITFDERVDCRDVGAVRHDRTGNARDRKCFHDPLVDSGPRPSTKQDEGHIGKGVGLNVAIGRPAVVAFAAQKNDARLSG